MDLERSSSPRAAPGVLSERLRRALSRAVALALVPPAVVAAVGSWIRPGDVPPGLAAALALVAVGGVALSRRTGSRAAGWWLTLAVVTVVLVWPEVALRTAGFRFDPQAVIQFGWPKPDHMVELDTDPDLFWTLPRSREWVNSHGFKGGEFDVPKPPGRWRVAFFGDSCTQLGIPSMVAGYLRSRPGGPRDMDAVNLGVVGYSSYQGRVLVERWTEPLDPDLGVIYFGWNDHWRAYGGTDAQKGAAWVKPYAALSPVLSASRLLQWIARRSAARPSSPSATLRVPIEEYRDNLVFMGERLEASGSRVLFLTAPSSYATVGVPDWIIDNRFADSKESALTLHRQYNRVVREVAREHGWMLLDLEAMADALPEPRDVFTKDGIHFTPDGVVWISRTIGDFVFRELFAAAERGTAGR